MLCCFFVAHTHTTLTPTINLCSAAANIDITHWELRSFEIKYSLVLVLEIINLKGERKGRELREIAIQQRNIKKAYTNCIRSTSSKTETTSSAQTLDSRRGHFMKQNSQNTVITSDIIQRVNLWLYRPTTHFNLPQTFHGHLSCQFVAFKCTTEMLVSACTVFFHWLAISGMTFMDFKFFILMTLTFLVNLYMYWVLGSLRRAIQSLYVKAASAYSV